MNRTPEPDDNEMALLLGHPLPHPERLTNQALLRFVFGDADTAERPFVTAFKGNPKSDAARWNGVVWWPEDVCDFSQYNAYCTLSTFKLDGSDGPDDPGEPGELDQLVSPARHRREGDMAALYGFMLDDVNEDTWRDMLPPTWVLETSPGNFQVAYLLREPLRDPVGINILYRAMIEYARGDKNCKNPPTRWVRLPQGVNGKYDPPFRCRMWVFNSEAIYTVEQLCVKMNLYLGPGELETTPREPVDLAALAGDVKEVKQLAAIALPAAHLRSEWVAVVAAIRGATLASPEVGLAIAMNYSMAENEKQLAHTAKTYWSIHPQDVRSGIADLRRHAGWHMDASQVFTDVDEAPQPDFYAVEDMPAEDEQARYIVQGLLDEGDFALMYGGSMAGKTFLVVDMACHLAAARNWMGCQVAQGVGVLVLANEGHKGVQRRIRAALKHMGVDRRGLPLVVTNRVVNLGRSDRLGPNKALLGRMRQRLIDLGARHIVIVFDTMATTWTGIDENEAKGLGEVIAMVNGAKGALVTPLVIHHPGKDVSKGPRGHSSLLAAADTAWRITHDERTSERALVVDKRRDGECGVPYLFELAVVGTGFDEQGQGRTTCVVKALGRREKPVGGMGSAGGTGEHAPQLRGLAKQCVESLQQAVAANDGQAVTRDAWWQHFLERRGRETPAMDARRIYKTANEGFRRALVPLIESEWVCTGNDLYWVGAGTRL